MDYVKMYSFGLFMAVCVYVFIAAGLITGRNGSLWWAAALPIFVSPLAMAVLRRMMEGGQPTGMFNPATQSWAFLADLIVLPFAYGAAALSWRKLADDDRYYNDRLWLLLAVLSGAAVAFAFRFIMNAPNYTKAGLGDLLQSPTSLCHDYVVYSLLTAVFMAVVLPAIIHDFSGYSWIAAIAMAVWVFGGVADATIHPLDPRNLHPPVQETILRR